MSMTNWLESLSYNYLPLTTVGLNPLSDWIFSCYEAIQLAYGTLMVLLMCPLVPEIMHGESSSASIATI